MDILWTTHLEDTIYKDALSIRSAVFITEQEIDQAIEIDQNETNCIHGVGYINGQPVCTLRLLPQSAHHLIIQRVAVLKAYRHQRLGLKLMIAVEEKAKQENYSKLSLSAQLPVIPFYQKLGYSLTDNSTYKKAGILHKDIYKIISL